MSGRFDFKVMIVGLPLGFLIANVLWINQYPDYEADMKGNKNWVVRLGKEKGILVYGLLFIWPMPHLYWLQLCIGTWYG